MDFEPWQSVGASSSAAVVDLILDRRSLQVLACDGSVSELFGVAAQSVVGANWPAAGGSISSFDPALQQIIASGASASVAPFFLRRFDGRDTVLTGALQGGPGHTSALRLWQWTPAMELTGCMQQSDTLVVIGVDQLSYGAHWRSADTDCLMMEVRESLREILRSDDVIGTAMGADIVALLRDVDAVGAREIAGAALSHASGVLRRWPAAAQARLCAGLAPVEDDHSGLSSLVRANNALLRLRHEQHNSAVLVASPQDSEWIAGHLIASGGLLAGHGDEQQRACLRQLTEWPRDASFCRALVHTVLAQSGVAAAALYRRRANGKYVFVAAADASMTDVDLEENELPDSLVRARTALRPEAIHRHSYCKDQEQPVVTLLLTLHDEVLGYLTLLHRDAADGFIPGAAIMCYSALTLAQLAPWRDSVADLIEPATTLTGQELEGYVGDNMEGAVDQAVFLAALDIPVAIVGARGTGKMYIARVVHHEWGGANSVFSVIDCREFRSRNEANLRIARELRRAEGKTLVFKSPQLLHTEVQGKLARQIATRTLADVTPRTYFPKMKIVALFPDELLTLVRRGELNEQLAGVFAGYPIVVPPIKDRRQAVLRWAQKILLQESAVRERAMKGFTRDAELALLAHQWPGNISEMRQCIAEALDRTDKAWLTPVDLGLFEGLAADGAGVVPGIKSQLVDFAVSAPLAEEYVPTALEALDSALGAAVNSLLTTGKIMPLGSWLDDEVVLAALERFGENERKTAQFLQTRTRNIGRWRIRIAARSDDRLAAAIWHAPSRLVREWLRGLASSDEAPLLQAQNMLLAHVIRQCADCSAAERAGIIGVSVPTYQKRLQTYYESARNAEGAGSEQQ